MEDGDDLLPTEEELLELKRDRDNIQIDVLFPGDEETYPQIGDVVRCHYVCKIADTGKEVENTRKAKQTFEFVLGIGQVIKGWDRGVLQMSFGERSKLTISAEYAYGEHGVKPLIPPYAKLIFDLELLRWHPRPHWSKPLIQQPGLTEYPYEDPRAAEETDEDQQLRAFFCCDSLLSKYGPTSCEGLVTAFQDDAEEAGMIVDLHACFVEERWRELPELPRQQRTELIDLMRKMTHAEQKKVGRACGKLLPMVCVLQLLNELPPKYCPLCRIKRAHEEQYLLEQGLEEETSQNKLALPFTPDVYCFEERSEDPSDANSSELRKLGLEDSDACVIFDKKGYNFRIDTARICPECRRGVYGVMAHLANDREYHHLTGKKKFKQLEARK